MKLNKWIYFVIGLLGIGVVGCEKQEPDGFDEIDGIYFNNRLANNTVIDSTIVTFVYISDDTLDIPLTVQLLGRPVDRVRPIDIRVSSEDAVEGVDYVLKTVAEMPADSVALEYVVSLKRTPELKQGSRTLYLELHANDHFTLPLSYQIQAGGDSVSILRYRIIFSDLATVAPDGWKKEFMGDFSQQKFELICRVLNLEPEIFVKKGQIPIAKWSYIYNEITAYVDEQAEKKAVGEPYDEEAFDKRTGEPIKFLH